MIGGTETYVEHIENDTVRARLGLISSSGKSSVEESELDVNTEWMSSS